MVLNKIYNLFIVAKQFSYQIKYPVPTLHNSTNAIIFTLN